MDFGKSASSTRGLKFWYLSKNFTCNLHPFHSIIALLIFVNLIFEHPPILRHFIFNDTNLTENSSFVRVLLRLFLPTPIFAQSLLCKLSLFNLQPNYVHRKLEGKPTVFEPNKQKSRSAIKGLI